MACRGGGIRGKRGRPKDIWDVDGGYMGMKKQKLLEQYSEQATVNKRKKEFFTEYQFL